MAGDITLIVHDALLLTLDPAEPEPFTGWLAVDDEGRIAAIGRGAPPPAPGPPGRPAPAMVDAGGAIVAPGFVSAHSHLFTSGSRGLGTDQSLYGWIEAMTRWTVHATPEDLYWLTVHGALDFLDNGITTAYDFTAGRLDFDAGTPQHGAFGGRLRPAEQGEAQFRAKLDAGIRFVNSVMLDDAAGSRDEVLGRLDDIVDYASKHADDPHYLGSAISGAVDKHRMSGFWDAELDSVLRDLAVTTLLFAGVNADQCVLATLVDAACIGYDVVLLEDCSATTSPPFCWEATVYNVRQCFGFTAQAADLVAALGGER